MVSRRDFVKRTSATLAATPLAGMATLPPLSTPPEPARAPEVLVRHEFQDESLEQIAEALGMSRNTAQSRLAEAKRIFRLRASKVLGDNRSVTPVLVPFGAETLSDADLQSPAFIEEMRKQVWQGIAHELGFDEPPADTVQESDEPNSLPKRILRRILD